MHKFHLTNKNPLALVLVLILFGGVFVYSKMQVSLFPEITFPKIKVIADAGLQPVDKMMVTVTKPLENAIKQVPDLHVVRSITSRGSCEISAYMNWDADIDLSEQRIESRINEIKNSLPADIDISVEKMNPSILPVMGYTLESNSMSPIELKQLANFTIKPFLSQVDGVSEIRIIGGKTKEYWIELDAKKMSTLGITPATVNTALSQTNFIKSNGYLSDYRYLYLTVTDATVHSKDDLENVVISNNGKRIVSLRDIAAVDIREAIEYTKINANGKEGILIAVIKQPNANLVDVSNTMENKIEELKKILPKNVSIKPYYVQADFVNDSIKSVTDSLMIGLVLAIIVAIIFLQSFKASATILITIPATLCLTLIILYAVGYTFNIMTLGALAAALGLIIDDAIVVVEQIHRTHEEYPEEPTHSLVHKAIKFLFPAMLGSSLSTIVIFIPFVLMSGVAGAYFSVMTNTMIITLTCSFFVTWIGLPVIYLLLSKKKKEKIIDEKNSKIKKVRSQRWVSFFILRPLVSLLFIAVLTGCIFLIYPKLKTGFLPEMDEGSIVLDYTSPPGTSLEETDRMLREVEKIITAEPNVQAYSRRTGTEMGFYVTEPNKGDYLIQLKKNRTLSTDEVIADLRKKIAATQPALRIDFGQVINDMLGDLMTSVQPIEIKIFGNDQQKLQQLSERIAEVVDSVKGTADVFNGITIAGPSVSIQPDFVKLAQFGITPADLQYQLQTSLQGNVAGMILEKEQHTNVRLVYPNSSAMSIDDIDKEQIFLPTGQLTPITQLANVTINKGDAEVKRENLQSMGVISARLNNRDLGNVIADIQKNIALKILLPQGYHIEYGGDYMEQQQSFKELLIILIAASLLVFAVILFLFKEIKVAFIVLLISVLGIAGSFIALFITGTPLNVGSYTGLIMIVGIIGENAIFTFRQFKEALLTQTVDEAIVYSISTRLRPKLMTALGAIIALMPLASGLGTGAQMHQPLAIAVIGGFVVAMPLLLIVLPSLLKMFYRKREIIPIREKSN
jgi:CzcA family heavy metal efflux pump